VGLTATAVSFWSSPLASWLTRMFDPEVIAWGSVGGEAGGVA